jgi:hypothetical protein
MADLDNSRFLIQQLHLQQAHQDRDLKDFIHHNGRFDIVGFRTSDERIHSFLVDWQISEPEKSEKNYSFLPT